MRSILAILMLLSCPPALAGDGVDAIRRAFAEGLAHGFFVSVSMDQSTSHVAARFYPATNTIDCNVASEYWSDPSRAMSYAFLHQWFSSDAPDHVVLHEAGHARMFRHVGAARMDELSRTPVDLGLAYVSYEVSIYGATNRAEFFAEVYAGLMAGRKFPADIMTRYNDLWRK